MTSDPALVLALQALVENWREAARIILPRITGDSDEGYCAALLNCAAQLAALLDLPLTPAVTQEPEEWR